MQNKTHYEILEVPPAATYPEIKKAYRRLAKKFHPDVLSNPSQDQQAHFAKIAEAYATLSSLEKRRAYDAALTGGRQEQKGPFRFTQPHYSGYPYFQYDIFTPFIHSFFMGGKTAPRSKGEGLRIIFLNYKTLLIALAGALYFFKFLLAMDGIVVEKKIESGLFDNLSYYLVFESGTGEKKEKKKRVKPDFYDKVKVGDRVQKNHLSFAYKINDEEADSVTLPRFLLQAGMIYLFISGALLFLEYARK